jgi:5-methylcytosine-specific restriction endonuclease McrA
MPLLIMRQSHSKCLLLNNDYTPLAIIEWQKAIVLLYKNNSNIEVLDFYKNDFIQCVNKKIPIPCVARVRKYCNIFNRKIKFSRKNLFLRDNHTCQYCGQKTDIRSLTYDHVVPKSKWSGSNRQLTTWMNVVTACTKCNRKKGNKTPQQANMPLLKQPYIPVNNEKYLPLAQRLSNIEYIPDEWNVYLSRNYID